MPGRKKSTNSDSLQLSFHLDVVRMPPEDQYPTNFEQSTKLGRVDIQ